MQIGIGMHTGSVFSGSVGSVTRKKYTVVGDTVTVASLLAGSNHETRNTILMTNDTCVLVRDHVTVVDRGEMKLPGRGQTVTVYEVLSPEREPIAL